MGLCEVGDVDFSEAPDLALVTIFLKASLLDVSKKTAGCFQGGRSKDRGKERTNGQECQGH